MFSSADDLVLASGSRYRRALLEQVGLAFTVCPADIDESPGPDEAPAAVATRLASEKARAVAPRFPRSLVIGSDQIVTVDGMSVFSKPITHEAAVAQLTLMSGRTVLFHTAVSVWNGRTRTERNALVPTEVRFRTLAAATIEAYLHRDAPYDCAGSARIEALGIALVERVSSDDPTALLGLPMIALLDLLAAEGVRVV